MPHPFWPLFDLEVTTPRLTLRYVDDALGIELATLAGAGIHDPAWMPFGMPWTDVPSPELERNALQFYWGTRSGTRPQEWNIQFAAIEAGVVVGSTNLAATGFPVRRTFETGSWLARPMQGRGIGTEMRIAILHVGFLGLDALSATTGAYEDNLPSLGVTRKLGYEPNGIEAHDRRGSLAEIHRYRMTRRHFLDHVRRDDIEIRGDAAVRQLLEIETISA